MLKSVMGIVIFASWGSLAFGAQTQFIPRVASEAGYESNAGLIEEGEEEDSATLKITGAFEAVRSTQRSNLYLRPSILVTRFLKDELDGLDSEEYRVESGASYSGERSEIGLRARFTQRPAYRSELDNAIPDDPDDPDVAGSGEITIRDDEQDLWDFRPYWNYSLSQRDRISVSGRFIDASYDASEAASGRADYQDIRAEVEWLHTLGPRNGIAVAGFVGEYSSDNVNSGAENDSDYAGGTVGYRWNLSELNTVELNLGATKRKETFSGQFLCTNPADILAGARCSVDNNETSFSGDVRWRRTGERNRLNVQLRRSVNPTSSGVQQLRNEARVYLNRDITPRLVATVGIIAYTQKDDADSDQDYLTAELSGNWRMTRRWSIVGAYRFVSRTTDEPGEPSNKFNNHEVRVGIQWQPERRP